MNTNIDTDIDTGKAILTNINADMYIQILIFSAKLIYGYRYRHKCKNGDRF